MEYIFDLTLKVRDYECDLQGIVNNANYQHYTEHTRHEFLRSEGISFADLHNRGIDAVVARLQMAFKTPLRSGVLKAICSRATTASMPRLCRSAKLMPSERRNSWRVCSV